MVANTALNYKNENECLKMANITALFVQAITLANWLTNWFVWVWFFFSTA